MASARSALIIGGSDYADPGLRRLRAPASDARALARVLEDPAIGGFGVRTLLNEPAHVVSLVVEEFFADRSADDLLLLHFSCHGVKDEDGELYFAMANTVLRRLAATAVSADFVNRRMNRSRSRRVVLLLDCCYAGAFERGMTARAGSEIGIESRFGGRGRAVITASSAMEYAFEGDVLADTAQAPPSVFTSALVHGLETGDADRDQDGLVGLDELYDYIYDRVRTSTPNQTPGKWTFGVQGELVIASRARPVTQPAPLPPELADAIGSRLASVRAAAVQELAVLLAGQHAGRALAARRALGELTEDDSRTVAAAASAALGSTADAATATPDAPAVPAGAIPARTTPTAPVAQSESAVPAIAEPDPAATGHEPGAPAAIPELAAAAEPSERAAGTIRDRRPGSARTPPTRISGARPDRLLVAAAVLAAASGIMAAWSLFPTFLTPATTGSAFSLSVNHAVTLEVVVAALAALAASALLAVRQARWLIGSGVLVGLATEGPNSVAFDVIVGRANPPLGPGFWLNVAGNLALTVAAILVVTALWRASAVRLVPKVPAGLLPKLIVLLGTAGAIVLIVLVLREDTIPGVLAKFSGQDVFPLIWTATMTLAVPAAAMTVQPRSFGLALLAGGLANDVAKASFYTSVSNSEFGITVVVLLVLAVILAVRRRDTDASGTPDPDPA